jgi:hypothetical protein
VVYIKHHHQYTSHLTAVTHRWRRQLLLLLLLLLLQSQQQQQQQHKQQQHNDNSISGINNTNKPSQGAV